MCAVAPAPEKLRPSTLPSIVVLAVGTTCAAGSACRRHAQRGNVHSGAPSCSQRRSQLLPPADPVAVAAVIDTSPLRNHPASTAGCTADGPKRWYDGAESGGKVASHPCA